MYFEEFQFFFENINLKITDFFFSLIHILQSFKKNHQDVKIHPQKK
jgi:hypothetical protein